MIAFQQTVLVLNVLLAIVFGAAYFVVEGRKAAPKTKARMGVLLASSFLTFLILLTLFAVLSAAQKRDGHYLALFFFVITPFAIGHLVSYRTLKFYTVVQMVAIILSAIILWII